MPHQTELIATIAAGLGLAFLFGLLAVRLRLPPIVGYLLAGVAVGPHSPGFVADVSLAQQLVAGRDANADGLIRWDDPEGGLQQAQEHVNLLLAAEKK